MPRKADSDDTPAYYDELHRWTQKDTDFQAFSGLENDTIHRFLIDPETGQFSPTTIYRFMDPHIPSIQPIQGLDAGCGYGGTCFRNYTVHGGRWIGVTISPEQWKYANGLAKARGLGDAVEFRLQSYDAPLAEKFAVAVAIESLIHSPDPGLTMASLAHALLPGGRLLVADDMPRSDLGLSDRALLDSFKAMWRCPVAPSAEEWERLGRDAGMGLVRRDDLSAFMKPREEVHLDAALADLESQRTAKTQAGFGRLSEAEIGGIHLERLQRRGAVCYQLLVFEKRR